MLEMGYQSGTGPLTIVTLQDTASAKDLAESFALIARAFGLINAEVKIDFNEPEEESETATGEEYDFKDFDEAMEAKQEFWAGEDPIQIDVKAEIECDKYQTLRRLIVNPWPNINPATLLAWADGYRENKQLASELVLLASILKWEIDHGE